MVLFYSRINWENFPSVNTALNAINLNAMDYAVKTLDERTVELDTVKANQSTVLNTIKDWDWDEDTGIVTITKVNGEKRIYDLNTEKIPVDFKLSEDGFLYMITDDGTVFTANIGSMIPVMTFENSDTISVTKTYGRKRIAESIGYSATFEHEFESPYNGNLYIAPSTSYPAGSIGVYYDVELYASDGAIMTVSSIIEKVEKAISCADIVKIVITNNGSAELTSVEIDDTKNVTYKFEVKDGSITEEKLQPNYLADIKVQAENAELSATASSQNAKLSESYAHGGTGTRDAEDTDNSKYYSEKAKEYAEKAESVSDIGIMTIEKAGIGKPDGKTITVDKDGTMHSNAGGTSGGLTEDSSIVFTQAENRENISVTDSLKTILGKISKFFSDLKTVAFTGNYNDLDNKPVLTNNLLATVEGNPLDSVQGRVLNEKIAVISSSLGGVSQFIVDETTGKISGYKTQIGGADTVFPFSGFDILWDNGGTVTSMTAKSTIEFDTSKHSAFIAFFHYNDITFEDAISEHARPPIGVYIYEKNVSYKALTLSSGDTTTISGLSGTLRMVQITDIGLYCVSINANSERCIPVRVYGIK